MVIFFKILFYKNIGNFAYDGASFYVLQGNVLYLTNCSFLNESAKGKGDILGNLIY